MGYSSSFSTLLVFRQSLTNFQIRRASTSDRVASGLAVPFVFVVVEFIQQWKSCFDRSSSFSWCGFDEPSFSSSPPTSCLRRPAADDPDAHFELDGECVPVVKNNLVAFNGGHSKHRTVVNGGEVQLLGPFHAKSMEPVGSTTTTAPPNQSKLGKSPKTRK